MESAAYQIRHPREGSLDFLRGIVVILMVAAHAIYFFDASGLHFFEALSRAGNTFAFTAFLFVSGAAGYLAHLAGNETLNRDAIKNIIRRSAVIFVSYLLIGIAALTGPDPGKLPETILSVVSFRTFPRFAEFLLPFVIFTLSLIPFSRIYRRLSSSLPLTAMASLISFVCANLLYNQEVPAIWRPLAAIISGTEGDRTYPILWYAPVFIAGLYWGNLLTKHVADLKKARESLFLAAGCYLPVIVIQTVPAFTSLPYLSFTTRWPPSAGFLFTGLSFIFGVTVIYFILKQIRILNRFTIGIIDIGMDSYDIYVIHILFLFLYEQAVGQRSPWPLLTAIFTIITIITSVTLSRLHVNFEFPRIIFRHSHTQKYKLKKRYFLLSALILILIFSQLSWGTDLPATGGIMNKKGPDLFSGNYGSFDYLIGKPVWHDDSLPYLRKITVNAGKTDLPAGSRVSFDMSYSHNETSVTEGYIYYTDDTQNIVRQKITLQNTDTGQTASFVTVKKIERGSSDRNYSLYFNKGIRQKAPADFPAAGKTDYVTAGLEKMHPLEFRQSTWIMIGEGPEIYRADLSWNRDNDPEGKGAPATIQYHIPQKKLSGSCTLTDTGCRITIDISDWEPGAYTALFRIPESGNIVSRRTVFNLSYPVYVAWTLDWEGWEVPESALTQILTIKKMLEIPLTHYFNPRLLVADDISEAAKNRITAFIAERINYDNDAFALHVHMQNDLVSAAGITPKTAPRWGYAGGGAGYDVPMTAYSEDEITRIINFAVKLVTDAGFPNPAGFRAGGWFADESVLAALVKTGFNYDASGHEHSVWNGVAQSPWNLTSDSQPYYPSVADQNRTGDPSLPLLEIPNAGGNTYEHTAEELIRRFEKSVAKSFTAPVAHVIVSHPQWPQTEFPKAVTVLNHIADFVHKNDLGPVIFVTTDDIYQKWTD